MEGEKEYLDLDNADDKGTEQILNQNYEKAAKRIIEELEKDKRCSISDIGRSNDYSTYMYINVYYKGKRI